MKLSLITYCALIAFTWAPAAFAQILTVQPSKTQINGKLISAGGQLVVEGRTSDLVTVGAGVRSAFGIVPVYVGELLVSDKKKYVCEADKALGSLDNLGAFAIRLQFVRGIGMSDLEKAFSDGADNNDVDPANPDVAKFMDAVRAGGDIPNGSTLVFSGEKLSDGEVVTYENAKGLAVSIHGAPGFLRNIFSLWLGNPGSDGGLKKLGDKLKTCQI